MVRVSLCPLEATQSPMTTTNHQQQKIELTGMCTKQGLLVCVCLQGLHLPHSCFTHYAFISPFKSLSNKLCALNLNFNNSKTKHPIAMYMHRFWNAAGACISLLCFINIITNTFMRDCTYHTSCFISICICYITNFKNPLNMLHIFDFDSSKTKHAIACWVLQ